MPPRRTQPVVPPFVPPELGDDLAEFLQGMDRAGEPQYRYQAVAYLTENGDDSENQAEILSQLQDQATTEPEPEPEPLPVAEDNPDAHEGTEEVPEGTEVNGEATEGSVEDTVVVPPDFENATRDELVLWADEHLGVELPGNISKSDAVAEIEKHLQNPDEES